MEGSRIEVGQEWPLAVAVACQATGSFAECWGQRQWICCCKHVRRVPCCLLTVMNMWVQHQYW